MNNHSDSTFTLLPRRAEHGATPAGGAAALPAMIRPRPICLADLEALVTSRHPLLNKLTGCPGQIDYLATIVYARDRVAQRRFANRRELASYLHQLLAC